MIKRIIEKQIIEKINNQKAIIIFGARQTGKTTLVKSIFSEYSDVLWLNGDDVDTHALFESSSAERLKLSFAKYKFVILDEAQRIENIGIKLKLITDQMPEIQLIATGSSSFELANRINEPLTGRKWEFNLFPISFAEMVDYHGFIEENRLMPHRLVYGYYPEVVTSKAYEKEVLKQISDSYLYKDILQWDKIKKSDKLIKLLKTLAYQVGSEVSYNELSKIIGIDNQTIEKYIDLLEQLFIIFRLNSFSRNHRKELSRSKKIYFYDNGIRNALIADFRLVESRNDIGVLWENFIISERIKYLKYNNIWANIYFWRTRNQQEIDFIEERDGVLYAYEFKWNINKKPKLSTTFSKTYPNHKYSIINPDNYETFIRMI